MGMINLKILGKKVLQQIGVKDTDKTIYCIYVDKLNLFILNFVSMYNRGFFTSLNEDKGGVFQTFKYIYNIIKQFEKDHNGLNIYNVVSEKGRSQSHKNKLISYKQNRNIDWDVMGFREKQEKQQQQRVFHENLDDLDDIMSYLSKDVNYIRSYYQEGDFVLTYLMFKYDEYLKENYPDYNIVHFIFSSDSDYKILFGLNNINIIIFDLLRKKFYNKYSYFKESVKYRDSIDLMYYKILNGEKSDNIEGVKGIGKKLSRDITDKIKEIMMSRYGEYRLNLKQNEIKDIFNEFTDKFTGKKIPKYIQNLKLQNKNNQLVINYSLINLQDINNLIDMLSSDTIKDINDSLSKHIENRCLNKSIKDYFKFHNKLNELEFESILEDVYVNNTIPLGKLKFL